MWIVYQFGITARQYGSRWPQPAQVSLPGPGVEDGSCLVMMFPTRPEQLTGVWVESASRCGARHSIKETEPGIEANEIRDTKMLVSGLSVSSSSKGVHGAGVGRSALHTNAGADSHRRSHGEIMEGPVDSFAELSTCKRDE